MTENRISESPGVCDDPRGQVMKKPEDVEEMLRLKACGWGVKRIGRQLGCSHHTVKRYLEVGGIAPFKATARAKKLDGLEDWLRARFLRHAGNADVVRQELARELGVAVSPRTMQRAVAAHRQALKSEALATVRFETPPGHQLQIDFGERFVEIGGQRTKVFVFVATLGHSRLLHVRAFRSESQECWFQGLESAFAAFSGVPAQILIDNPRALVTRHDSASRIVQFNAKFLAFAKHWGFSPRACAPYRARTKGKTERGVGYVKKNAIAGRRFESWAAFEAHLAEWERDIANARIHGTTGEAPIVRFRRDEAHRLAPLADRAPFGALREVSRMVSNECAVEIDSNFYSVPWRLIGERVAVTIAAGMIRIRHGAREVAAHTVTPGRRQRIIAPEHLEGVAGRDGPVRRRCLDTPAPDHMTQPALLRPLSEYEAAIGGGF